MKHGIQLLYCGGVQYSVLVLPVYCHGPTCLIWYANQPLNEVQ